MFEAALAALTAPLRARLKRHPKLRPEQIAGVERAYTRTIPAKFTVGGIPGAKTKSEFAVTETRLTASWLIDWTWEDREKKRGLSVCKLILAVQGGRLIQH